VAGAERARSALAKPALARLSSRPWCVVTKRSKLRLAGFEPRRFTLRLSSGCESRPGKRRSAWYVGLQEARESAQELAVLS
jgi:hypothetical protein